MNNIDENFNVCEISTIINKVKGIESNSASPTDTWTVYFKDNITYDNILQDEHRKIWKKGEWTDDTDMCLILFKHFLRIIFFFDLIFPVFV